MIALFRLPLQSVSLFAMAFLIASACPASAQAVNLACGGVYHVYPPEEPLEATVAPTASSVDLANKAITTPLGEYRISSINDVQIFFDNPASPSFNFVAHGSLDRVTGKMMIRWLRPEEDVREKSLQTVHMARYAELTCSAAKRLF
jgi:hypothetical protein